MGQEVPDFLIWGVNCLLHFLCTIKKSETEGEERRDDNKQEEEEKEEEGGERAHYEEE